MKRSLMKIFALVLVVVMLTAVFASCKKEDPTPAETTPEATTGAETTAEETAPEYTGPTMTVKVGVMCPVTGTNSRMGIREKASIDAAMAHMAEDKFLNPAYELEIMEFVDDQNTTDQAPIAANLMISEDPHVVIGHHYTTMILAVGDLFEAAQIPLIGMVSGPASVQKGWEYFHIGTVTDTDAASSLAEYLVKEKNLKNFLVMARNDEGGMAGAEAVIAKLKELGIDFKDEAYMKFGIDDTDFTPYALKAKELGVDAVLTYGLSAANALTCYDQIENLYAQIPEKVFFAGSTSFAQPDMAKQLPGDKLQGIVFPTGYIQDPENAFKERFKNTFKANDPDGQWPGDNDARVYDACWNIAAALNLMIETEGVKDINDEDFREKLNYYISQLDREGVQGHIEYKAFTDGRILKAANIGEWQADGQAIKVYPKG